MLVDQYGNKLRTTGCRVVQARYDAAQPSVDNDSHWSMSDSLSAVSANSASVRQRLRERSRYEVANNSYARGIVNSLADYTVGSGPRLNISAPAGMPSETANLVESLFTEWSEANSLPSKLHTMHLALSTDGESFARFIDSNASDVPISIGLRLYEADHFDDYSGVAQLQDDAGVRINSAGEVTEYAFLENHPGDSLQTSQESDWIDASGVIHLLRRERPGQLRGIPRTTPALPLFAMLRRFTLATVTAAETAASFSAILESDAPAEDADPITPFEVIAIERGAMVSTPSGARLKQFASEHPNATYDEFVKAILREIARCLSVPAAIALGDSSNYNYSSGRLDLQAFQRQVDVERELLFAPMLRRIYRAWLAEASLIDGYLPDDFDTNWPVQWQWPGQGHVDRAKEANGQQTELANHTTTLAREYARQGLDWERELRQVARERQLMQELGLTLEQAAPTPDESQPEQ